MCTLWRRMGEWSYSPLILNLDIRWRWEVRFKLRPLYEFLRYPLERRLELRAGPGISGEEMNVLPLQGIEAEFIGRAARNIYVLYQMSSPGWKTVNVTSTLQCSMSAVNSRASLNFQGGKPLSTMCGKNDDVTFPSVTEITRICHETKECLTRGYQRQGMLLLTCRVP